MIDRCLSGDPLGWEQLYRTQHELLLRSIRALLGPQRDDLDLVEELAARVWYAVLKNDGELLARFDPERACRLSTYLTVIARSEAARLFRAERRRRRREKVASQRYAADAGDSEEQTRAALDEFLRELTPRERGFCASVLLSLGPPSGSASSNGCGDYTETNRWQLRSRIRRKLVKYVGAAEKS